MTTDHTYHPGDLVTVLECNSEKAGQCPMLGAFVNYCIYLSMDTQKRIEGYEVDVDGYHCFATKIEPVFATVPSPIPPAPEPQARIILRELLRVMDSHPILRRTLTYLPLPLYEKIQIEIHRQD